MKTTQLSALFTFSNIRLLAVSIVGMALFAGCQSTSQIARGPQSTFSVATVGEAPGVQVFGGDMDLKNTTAAAVVDVLRHKDFMVVPSDAVSRYEVQALWRVSSGVDGRAEARAAADPENFYLDASTREARLLVTVVDLQRDGKVVYEGASWPIDTRELGTAMVRSAVDTALSNL